MPRVARPGLLTVLLLGLRPSLSVRKVLERIMMSFEALEFGAARVVRKPEPREVDRVGGDNQRGVLLSLCVLPVQVPDAE